MAGHSCPRVAVIVSTLLIFLVSAVLNLLARVDIQAVRPDLFINRTGELWRFHKTEISPPEWTVYIWPVIYVWQLLFLLYGMSTIGRSSGNGYLYIYPSHLQPSLYIIYSFSLLCNIAWLFLWDRRYVNVSLAFVAVMSFTFFVCIYMSATELFNKYPLIVLAGNYGEHRYVIWLVHNALGLSAGWATVTTTFNLAVVLVFSAGLSSSVASSVCLALLTFEMILYALFDMAFAEKYVRFLFTPYVAVFFGLVGSLLENWDRARATSVFNAGLLVLVIGLLLIKLCVSLAREFRKSVYGKPFVGDRQPPLPARPPPRARQSSFPSMPRARSISTATQPSIHRPTRNSRPTSFRMARAYSTSSDSSISNRNGLIVNNNAFRPENGYLHTASTPDNVHTGGGNSHTASRPASVHTGLDVNNIQTASRPASVHTGLDVNNSHTASRPASVHTGLDVNNIQTASRPASVQTGLAGDVTGSPTNRAPSISTYHADQTSMDFAY